MSSSVALFSAANQSVWSAIRIDWLIANIPDILLILASLTLAAVLWPRRGCRGTPLRRVFMLLGIFAVCGAVADLLALLGELPAGGVNATVKYGIAAFVWCVVLGLVWSLPGVRRVGQQPARQDDLDRLRLLAAAVGASGDGVMIAEVERGTTTSRLRIVYTNPAFERMTGYSCDEAVGLSPSIIADDAEPESLETVRRALRGTELVRVEVPGRRKDGGRVWTEWQVVPVADDSGRFTHSIAVLRDTTDRRRAEQAVRDSEARFRGLFEQAADAIFLIDSNGRIIDANRLACQSLGYTRDELMALRVFDLAAGGRGDSKSSDTFTSETRYRRKDGTEFPVEVRLAEVDAAGRRLRLALVRDVTRRRRAEQTLREREELLRNIIANIPCGVFWKDRNSIYLGCNEQLARDNDLPSPAHVVGKCDFDLCSTTAEAEFYRDCDRKVIETGRPILNLEQTQSRSDGTVAILLTSKVPLRDATGAVVGLVGVYQDITERKRLEEQLRQAQKMEAVGRLAGGIAHDFNNLLTIIRGNADLLRSLAPGEANPVELIDDLRSASDRAAGLVRQLLMFSRRQPARLEVVDLNATVAGLAGLLSRLLGERIAIETRLAPGPVTTRADHSHLEQVVMNLAVNARDAMPEGGTLTLATEVDDSNPAAPIARLIVSDTGVGMSDRVKSQIFEPFFTTKGPDKGTGLGLATVFGIVQQAGGRIDVKSSIGEGTTFHINLPWCDGQPASLAATPLPIAMPERPAVRGADILLVEDEDAVRKLARITLEGRGHTVTDAPDGESALALLTPDSRLDVLVTDMTMPGIDGRELAGRIRALRPGVGVVFVSGYVPDAGRLDGIPGAVFLPKPFTPSDLVRAVSRALPRVGVNVEPVRTEQLAPTANCA